MPSSDSTKVTIGALGVVERRLGRTARAFAGQLDDLPRAISNSDASTCRPGVAIRDESAKPLHAGEETETDEEDDGLGSR
jgi:hypothetical protein